MVLGLPQKQERAMIVAKMVDMWVLIEYESNNSEMS